MTEKTSVLHVDSDPDCLGSVARAIEYTDEAIDVCSVTDPEAARSRLATEAERIDCVVSEYDLPDTDGLALLGGLREIDPTIPFVLFTDQGSEAIAARAISAGITDYVRKDGDTDCEALAERVVEIVSERRAPSSREPDPGPESGPEPEPESNHEHPDDRYERLLERSPAPIVLFEEDAIVYANGAAADFLGAGSPEEIVGTPPIEFVHPEDRAFVTERIGRVLENRETVGKIEERIVDLDGETRHATIATSPVLEGGDVMGQAVLNDRTERKRAEAALADERAVTETALDSLRDVFYVIDTEGRLVRWNDRVNEVTGYTDREIEAMAPTDFFPEDDRERVMGAIGEVLETGRASVTVDLLTKAGDQIPHEFTGASLTDADGEPIGLCGIGRDTSDRQAYEPEPGTTRSRFRSLTENTSLGVVTIDAESTVRYANDAVEDLFGYSAEELVGDSLATVIPDHLEAAHFEAIARYVREGDRRLDWEWIELPARHRDGHEVPIGVSFGEFTVDGETRFTGVIRDITDRKEREEALERSEALLDETQRMASVGGWELDPATDELRWTEEINRIYGFPIDCEPTLAEALDAFLPEDADALEDAINRAIEIGEGYDLEARLRGANGELRWVRTRGEAERNDGETVALRGSLQDITGRKRRERDLERYEAAIETIDDAVYVLDEKGRFEFVNEAFLELTGYEGESVLGSGVGCIKDEPTVERFEALIGEMLSNGVAETTVEFETRTADGEVIPCEDHLGPRLVDGEFRGVAGVIRDITDRKERERALRTLHEATREMMAADSRQAVSEIASETATEVLDLPMNGVHLQGETGGLVPIAVSQATRETLGAVPTIEPGEAIAWQVFTSGEPLAVDDVSEHPAVLDPETPIRSELYLPLGDHGVFILSSTVAEDFTEADVALAKVLAANVETALDRVEQERTLETLHTGTRAMMNAETTEEVYGLAVETARDALGLRITGFWSYDPEAVALRPAAVTDGGHALFEEIPTFTPENSLSWDVFATGEPAVYDDVSTQPNAYDPETPIASEIIVPVGDYGVLNSGSTEAGTFDASDVSTALILTANVEAALERAEREALLRDRETQLARERDNLAALFENVPDPMVRYERADGTVIPRAVNPAFERVFGYEEGQVIDRPLTETIVPSEEVDEHADLTAAASAGESLNAEIERTTATGRRTFLLRNAPIDVDAVDPSTEERATGYAIYTDITERREAERYRGRLYEIVADAEATSEQRVNRLLELGCERLGVERGSLTRIENDTQRIVNAYDPSGEIEPGAECPLSRPYCRRTIEGTNPTLTVSHASESGWADDPAYETFGFETYVGSTLSVDGDLYGTVCFGDRSPRERGFSAVETAFVDLLTRGIASELERRQYERALERQNERLEQFASVLSHDLRNPLSVAKGYLEFLPEEGNEDALTKIETAHDRMERIIEDVLALTRQGETVVETQPVALEAVAQAAWEHVETEEGELEFGPDPGTVEADRSRLETLFENLFRNSVEHGGSAVRLEVGSLADRSGFFLADDGPGIPVEKREQVFEYGHTTSDSGTGLGLSIVRTVADAHGWTVTATESEGGGARFELSVPEST
jgi:PAS domain S-box-containing protein